MLSQPVSGLTLALSELIPTPRSIVDKYWLQGTRDTQVATAGGCRIILVPDSRSSLYRLRAGRLWQRMHLWALKSGIGTPPMNQIIERAEREQSASSAPVFTKKLASLIGDSRSRAVMAYRLGYPTQDARPKRAAGRRSCRDQLGVPTE